MKAAILPLVFGALVFSAAAHARPEQAWRELQRESAEGDARGGETAGSARRGAPATVPVTPAAPPPAPMAAPRQIPQAPRAPQAAPSAPPASVSRGERHNRDNWNSGNAGRWGVPQARNSYPRYDFDRYRAQTYRYSNHRYYSVVRFRVGSYVWPRGYSYSRWSIGELLPWSFYYDDRYYLDQYWSYRLYAPPAGCRWMRVGDDALLISRYDGEVLDIIYDVFW